MLNEEIAEALDAPVREAEARGRQQMLAEVLAFLRSEERVEGLDPDCDTARVMRRIYASVADEIGRSFPAPACGGIFDNSLILSERREP